MNYKKAIVCFCSLICARRGMGNSLPTKSDKNWWLWWALCWASSKSTKTFKRNTYLLIVDHQELYSTAWNLHFGTINRSTHFSDSERKSFFAALMPCIWRENIFFAEEKAIANTFQLIFARCQVGGSYEETCFFKQLRWSILDIWY